MKKEFGKVADATAYSVGTLILLYMSIAFIPDDWHYYTDSPEEFQEYNNRIWSKGRFWDRDCEAIKSIEDLDSWRDKYCFPSDSLDNETILMIDLRCD